MELLTGIIQKNGLVLAEDKTLHQLPIYGIDNEGYYEVLIDARDMGGSSSFHRQSIKPYIGMTVEFIRVTRVHQGYNFILLKSLNK